MAELESFLLFVVLPSAALLSAIGLSLYEVHTIGERKLLVIVIILGLMLQHQLLEWAAFWGTGQVVEGGLGEVFETGANLIASGSVYYVLRFTREEQRLRRDLEQQKQQYRGLLKGSPVAILLHGPEQIRYANEAATELFDAGSASNLEGQPVSTFLSDSDDTATDGGIDVIGETGTAGGVDAIGGANVVDGIDVDECHVETLAGDERTVLVASAPARYRGEDVTQMVLRDVTAERQYRRELEATQDRLEKTFDNIRDGILLIDIADERIIQSNARAAEMLAYPQEELLELSPYDIHPHESGVFEEFARVVQIEGNTVTDQLSCRRKDGKLLPVEVAATVTEIDDRTCILVALRDVADRKRRERQVSLLHRVLRHNLRNQMTIVRGNAEALAERDAGGAQSRAIQRIIDATDDLISMSRAGKRLDRLVQREKETLRSQQDLVAVVEEVLDEYRREYPGATVEAELPEQAFVRADETVRWAIEHLVDNALRHADSPAPTVRVAIDAADRDEDGWVTVTVSDDGPGIPDQEREVVTGDRERTALEHGSGLGLWIVSQVARTFGGEFDITDDDVGTTATLRLQTLKPATASQSTPLGRAN